MNRQTKAEKSAIHLSDDEHKQNPGSWADEVWGKQAREQKLKHLVGRANFSFDEYRELATLWKMKGHEIWRKDPKQRSSEWRHKTMARLGDEGHCWQELVVDTLKKPTSEQRTATNDLLTQAHNDPVMFLNLCGMPPLLVLQEIEITKQSREMLASYHSLIGSKKDVESFTLTLRHVARAFDKIAPFIHWAILDLDRKNRLRGVFSDEREYKNLPITELPASETVMGWAALFADLPNFRGLPSRRKHGGQFKSIDSTLESLYEKCVMQMGQRLTGRRHAEESPMLGNVELGHRTIDGAIAAILSAAFPDDFKVSDLLRKVRRVVKNRNLEESWSFWSS
jgi:hypothetical protein